MDKISIKIPPSSIYIKSVRLFAAGLGSDLDFNIEQIEDLKVLVSEAINYKLGDSQIEIDFEVGEKSLKVIVNGQDKSLDERALKMRDAILSALADDLEIKDNSISFTLRA